LLISHFSKNTPLIAYQFNEIIEWFKHSISAKFVLAQDIRS